MSYVVDLLHAWCLGPLGAIVAFIIHFCVATGVFGPATSLYIDSENRDKLAMVHIRTSDLLLFCLGLLDMTPSHSTSFTTKCIKHVLCC